MYQRALLLALSIPAVAVASTMPPPSPDLGPYVAGLVDDTARDPASERRAFDHLIKLGRAGVPYIVGHLGDHRRLPEQSIWVMSPGRPDRQHQPWYVHDGLEYVLNEVTGFSMSQLNGHMLRSQRERSTRKWVAWCVDRYPAQAAVCRGGAE